MIADAVFGDEVFARVADAIFKPVVEKFRPQMLFISAGFDAHWNNSITSLGLSTRGFFNISKKLVDLAEEYCNGKIVFVLEGGYDPHNVANGSAAIFDALTNSTAAFTAATCAVASKVDTTRNPETPRLASA